MIPELETIKGLEALTVSFIFWFLIVLSGFVGYFVGVENANSFWLGQGDYHCERYDN